jgi:hypothetical protein
VPKIESFKKLYSSGVGMECLSLNNPSLTEIAREKGKAELDAFTEDLLAQANPKDRTQNASLFRLAYFAVRAYTEHFPHEGSAHCNKVFPRRLGAYVSELQEDEREEILGVLFDFCVDKRILVRCCEGFPQVHGGKYKKYSFSKDSDERNPESGGNIWIHARNGSLSERLQIRGHVTHSFCPECVKYSILNFVKKSEI